MNWLKKNLVQELKYNIEKDVEFMGQIIFNLIGVLILLAGVILIYDARVITKKVFGFGDQNEATAGFKILGVIISLIGALIIYF